MLSLGKLLSAQVVERVVHLGFRHDDVPILCFANAHTAVSGYFLRLFALRPLCCRAR
jgi:hypothetical protein